MKRVCVFALTWALFATAHAQLGERNHLGIRMGHVHLLVRDLDAERHFWTSVMGGKLVRNGSLELIEFPDLYVVLEKAADPPPSEGSVVDHFGFIVKDFPAA